MRRQLTFFFLVFLLAGWTAQAQQQDTPPACAPNCPAIPAKPAAATPDAAKPVAKRHKVITNEDFDARPHEISVEGGRDILQAINTCDRTCFNEVAQRARVSDAHWKLILLDAIDTVKADSTWQGLLGEILGVQARACELEVEKTRDLQRFSDPRTVTPGELAIERQYEPKFREIKNRLNAVLDRANGHVSKSSQGVLQTSYMQWQVDKLVHATCRITVPRPPEDTDDPEDP